MAKGSQHMSTFLKRLLGIRKRERAYKQLTWRNARTWAEWKALERCGEILILSRRPSNTPTIYWRPEGFDSKEH